MDVGKVAKTLLPHLNVVEPIAREIAKDVYDPETKTWFRKSILRPENNGGPLMNKVATQGYGSLTPEEQQKLLDSQMNLIMGVNSGIQSVGDDVIPQAAKTVGPVIDDAVQKLLPAPQAFEGFDDVTTKMLDTLKGKVLVNPQVIKQELARPNYKKPEKDIIQSVLDEFEGSAGKISVKDFAGKVKKKLLPLTPKETSGRWNDYTLGNKTGEDVNYNEIVYESPIKTKAGDVHFNQSEHPGYFGHVRAEDLLGDRIRISPDEYKIVETGLKERPYALVDAMGEVNQRFSSMEEANRVLDLYKSGQYSNQRTLPGNIRRVNEIQSDLFQRGRYEKELAPQIPNGALVNYDGKQLRTHTYSSGRIFLEDPLDGTVYNQVDPDKIVEQNPELNITPVPADKKRAMESYKGDNWWQRLIRQEIQRAAKDDKMNLRFPTGNTAAHIEGYVDEGAVPRDVGVGETFDYGGEDYRVLSDEYGDSVSAVPERAIENEFSFATAKQEEIDSFRSELEYDPQNYAVDLSDYLPDDEIEALKDLGVDDFEAQYHSLADAINRMMDDRYPNADSFADEWTDSTGMRYIHTGDDNIVVLKEGWEPESMSRGVSSPSEDIYDQLNQDQQRVFDFYENDITGYLKKLKGDKVTNITDDNGYTWVNVPIDPSDKKAVEAFQLFAPLVGGAAALKMLGIDQETKDQSSQLL